jgi:hypothetical protein
VTAVSYFPLNYVEVWTGFVWFMIGAVNMVQPSAIIFFRRRVLCCGISFVSVNLYIAMQQICTKHLLSVFTLHEMVLIVFSFM